MTVNNSDFVHLHVHSDFSMLDGKSQMEELVKRVVELGMPGVAVTDHGVLFGAVDLKYHAKELKVNGIIGIEFYIAPGSRYDKKTMVKSEESLRGSSYYHLTALAENQIGYSNLMKLSSRSYTEGFFYKQRIDKEILEEHNEGLIVLSGCLGGELNQVLLEKGYEAGREVAGWYKEVFQDRYFIELMDHGIEKQKRVNPMLIRLAQEMKIPMVATNDSHFTLESDREYHDALLCLQTKAKIKDTDRFRFNGEGYYLRSAREMHALFPDLPETWKNTLLINERCNVQMDFDTQHLPKFETPRNLTEAEYLWEKIEAGAIEKYGEGKIQTYDELPEVVRDRLKYEYDVIVDMGFPAYMLIVADLIDHANKTGIRVGPGRGSAAGCAIAYVTDITKLDPLKYGLIFERFLNPSRVSMPDIDIDFEDTRRGDMILYAAEKYGDGHVAGIVTYSTIGAKQAVNDAARVLDYPVSSSEKIVKLFPPANPQERQTIKGVIEESSELAKYIEATPEAQEIINLAKGLEGVNRQASVHAAGVVIADEKLSDVVPTCQLKTDGETVTQYNGKSVEKLGLLKMDFLGLRNLSVITGALDLIKETRGIDLDIDNIDITDANIYQYLSTGETDSIFQLESSGYKSLCRKMRPTEFADIIALGALYRPGPMAQDLHNEYARRKNDPSLISYVHPDLESILEDSYGLTIYQEQVQKIVQKVAGFSLGRADEIRRAIGKKLKDLMEELHQEFIEGSLANGYDKKLVTDLWEGIFAFSKYAFNKSHSAAYGLVTFQTAFLKYYYPVEYMAALLSSLQKKDKNKFSESLYSCLRMGIELVAPDINRSEVDFMPVVKEDGSAPTQLMFGLSAVRSAGEDISADIVKTRKQGGKFKDIYDLFERISLSSLKPAYFKTIANAGAFESLHPGRKGLISKIDTIAKEVIESRKKAATGQMSIFAVLDSSNSGTIPNDLKIAIPNEEYSREELFDLEFDALGAYVSDHPLSRYTDVILSQTTGTTVELIEESEVRREENEAKEAKERLEAKNNPQSEENSSYDRRGPQRLAVKVGGMIGGLQVRYSKKDKKPFARCYIEDIHGRIDIFLRNEIYEQYIDLIKDKNIVVVNGGIKDDDPPLIFADVVQGVYLPDDGSLYSPLVISMDSKQVNQECLAKIDRLLRNYPGESQVNIIVNTRGYESTKLVLGDHTRVARDGELIGALNLVLGEDAVH